MTQPGLVTQWSSIVPFFRQGSLPTWVPPIDQQRIASYTQYEQIYWQAEEGMVAVMRGDNDRPVQMPTARTLVNTVNRYTAPEFSFRIEGPDATTIQIAQAAFNTLFIRERFFAQFNGAKRMWIIQGDWFWHLLADPLKPPGRRLSVEKLDPGAVFPVYESDVDRDGDPTKLIKVHIAEPISIESETRVSRLTYEKEVADDGTVTIFRSHGIFKIDGWQGAVTPTRVILPREPLPEEITALPVYHLKNFDDTAPFGSSELRGMESVLLGINQTVSDEDLTLAMDGLGLWATDGGVPVDEKGNEVEWIFGPGRVITRANGLRRLEGVGSVVPYGDHYERLLNAVRLTVGASDVAIGRVDASTAESGIALLLQLGPILSYTAEKDRTIVDVHAQMFHDLCVWLSVYEDLPLLAADDQGAPTPAVTVIPLIGAKIPVNQQQLIKDVIDLRSVIPPLISLSTALTMLREAGVPVQQNEEELITTEQQGALSAGDVGAGQDTTDQERADQELGQAS